MSALATWNATLGVGFGTAGLGSACFDVVTLALEAGFRKFDTAEADWWYDQKAVGQSLQAYFELPGMQEVCESSSSTSGSCGKTCQSEDLRISTKIPPWSLTSENDIRGNAAASRDQLLGFCKDVVTVKTGPDGKEITVPYPMDVYYIHAPNCWKGWHPKCDNPPPLLDLRSAWLAMEAVVGLDHAAHRIGLSNVHPHELLDILEFVRTRQETPGSSAVGLAPPRAPDVIQAYADPIYPAEDLREICREHGIEFVSYSTLGTQHRSGSGNPILGSPIVTRIAQKHARSAAEVVLSWALQNGMSVIPRSSKPQHIKELARLLEENSTFLEPVDLADIDSMKDTM